MCIEPVRVWIRVCHIGGRIEFSSWNIPGKRRWILPFAAAFEGDLSIARKMFSAVRSKICGKYGAKWRVCNDMFKK